MKESPSQTGGGVNKFNSGTEKEQSSPLKEETSPFVKRMPDPFLVINYDKSFDMNFDREVSLTDDAAKNSSSRGSSALTKPREKLNTPVKTNGTLAFEDGNVYIPRLSMCAQRTVQARLPSRNATPADTCGQSLRDSTNRLPGLLEKEQSFLGHNYVRNDQARPAALPCF